MARLNKKAITKTVVDALTPGMTAWDSKIPGFGCRCQSQGKFYILKYRTKGNRQRWHTIGLHGGPWTPETARKEALSLRTKINEGADPSGSKQQKRYEKTISELADRYLEQHVRQHNKPSTIAEVERIIEKRIKPELGQLKITELTRADVKNWHQNMSGIPTEANRALAYCSKMLSLAATEWEFRSDNPCIGIKRFPEKPREEFYSTAQMQAISEALFTAEKDGSEVGGFILLVRLLALTGMRLGEVHNLRWTDIDLQRRVIRLQDAKAGGRTVPLSPEAVALLANQDSQEGWIITDSDDSTLLPLSSIYRAWGRIRKAAGIPQGRLHDLRHTVGTYAALDGANAFAIRDLLGHKTMAMTNRYVARAADMTRATADAVSTRISNAMAQNARADYQPGAEIIPLKASSQKVI